MELPPTVRLTPEARGQFRARKLPPAVEEAVVGGLAQHLRTVPGVARPQDPSAGDGDANARDQQRRERRAILNQMMAEAEELGLYDDPPRDYRPALKDPRSENSRTQESG